MCMFKEYAHWIPLLCKIQLQKPDFFLRKLSQWPITKAFSADGLNILFMLTYQKSVTEMRSANWLSQKKSWLFRGLEKKVLKGLTPTLDWWTEVYVWTGSKATVVNRRHSLKWLFKWKQSRFSGLRLSLPLFSFSPSLAPSASITPAIKGGITELKDWQFCSLPTQSCSSLLPTAASLSLDAEFLEKHAEEKFPCTTGDGHNSVQQMSNIKEQRNDGCCSLTGSALQIRRIMHRCC